MHLIEESNRTAPTRWTTPIWLIALFLLLIPSTIQAQAPEQTIYLPNITTATSTQPLKDPPPSETTLSSQERLDIAQAVETRVNELLPPIGTPLEERDFQGEVQQLGEQLLSIPGVIATLVTTATLTVQVVMEDGTSIAIVNNRPIEAAPSAAEAQAAAEHFVAQQVEPHKIVGSSRAVVANYDGGGAVAAAVRTLLNDAGYQVLGLGASLSDMQDYKNLGALYLDTHGVQFQQFSLSVKPDGTKSLAPGSMLYGLQTSTQISLQTLESYKTSLNNGELLLSIGEESSGRRVKFGITSKFIAKYWSFDQAVVIIHACYGGSGPFKPGVECNGGSCFSAGDTSVLDPSLLRAAMLAQGASAVVSFDTYTNADYARPSIVYLLDRLLGQNSVNPIPNPKLRLFPLDQVRTAMSQQGLLSFSFPAMVLFGVDIGGRDVNLTFDTKDTTAGLAPTVERVTVLDDADKPQGELKIKGKFPATQGQVIIDSLAATIKSWKETEIVVNTPFNGQGAAGDLTVKSPGNIESNPVPITLWAGNFKFKTIPNLGSLQATADIDLTFRADLHESRATLDATPDVTTQDVYLVVENSSRVQASGVYVDPDDGNQVAWANGGKLIGTGKALVDIYGQIGGQAVAQTIAQDDGLVGGIVTLDPDNKTARLCLFINGYHDIIFQSSEGSSTVLGPVSLFGDIGLADNVRGALSCFQMTMQDSYTITAGSRSVMLDEIEFQVEWSQFAPVSPPTDTTPG